MSNPIVTFEMENGKVFKAELYPEVAPNTVNNFLSLVRKGFYDGVIFHRVIPGFSMRRSAKSSREWTLWMRSRPRGRIFAISRSKNRR